MTAKAKAKPAPPWKPVPVAVQVRQHKLAVAAAKKAAAAPPAVKKARHAAGLKAAATRKKAKKHGLALSPDDVACCAAQAVAESLRLTLGVPVSHDDVLALYWLVADDADAGASILATLEAAQEFAEHFVDRDGVRMHPVPRLDFHQTLAFEERRPVSVQGHLDPVPKLLDGQFRLGHPLILGLDLPEGPHAVLEHDGVWWSWGEAYEPWDAPVTESWAVTW